MLILLVFTFLAGILTVLAPCTLPMVPLILGTAAGGGRARPLGIIAGLAVSFTVFSVVLAAALDALGLTTSGLRLVAVGALAVFGLALLVPAVGARLEALLAPLVRLGTRAQGDAARGGGFGGGVVLGGALGLVWAPCTGPIMATVIALAATRGAALDTAAITLAYALGAGVPLLAIAYGGRALARRTGGLIRGGVQRAFGALVLVTCLAILFNLDLRAQDAVAGVLPADWTAGLYTVEQVPAVQKELRNLKPALPPAVVASAPGAMPPAAPATAVPATAVPAAALPATAVPATAVPAAALPATAVPATAVPATPTAPPPPAAAGLPAPLAAALPGTVQLENLGPAPDITGITDWINAKPFTLKELRGKVVLVHFWTFACINCIHVQPYVKSWYARYKDAGFVVVGVHTPELSFEKEIANVRDAVQKDGVTFPVLFDPQYATWNAYHNGYWPAFYYVDKAGQIRYTHVGEGDYEGQEQVIRELLLEPAK